MLVCCLEYIANAEDSMTFRPISSIEFPKLSIQATNFLALRGQTSPVKNARPASHCSPMNEAAAYPRNYSNRTLASLILRRLAQDSTGINLLQQLANHEPQFDREFPPRVIPV